MRIYRGLFLLLVSVTIIENAIYDGRCLIFLESWWKGMICLGKELLRKEMFRVSRGEASTMDIPMTCLTSQLRERI